MTVEQYWIVLVKHWRLIVICFLAVGAGASLGSRLMTTLYQSSALVQVTIRSSNNQADYNSLLASDQLVQTEADLATTDPVLREVASHYRGLTVEQLSKEVTATPKLNTQLFEIDVQDSSPVRAAALANDIATTLIKQQLQVFEQNSTQSGDFLLVVQPAQPTLTPVRPNMLLNTGAGLLTGLFLGMLLALLLELLDTRVRTPEALIRLLGWPIIATIWLAYSSKNEKEAVFNPSGHSAYTESYRILRTNIGFAAIDKPLRSLVITSAAPLEGKSTIAANLAIFMARAGKVTLLIDADLRHPIQQQLFGLSADTMGLSNLILEFAVPTAPDASSIHRYPASATPVLPSSRPTITQTSLDPFVHAVDIPNLYVMPSGPLPPNPSELLDSKAIEHLFTALDDYGAEVVIFDTPPLLGLADASILASKADGTLVAVDITRAKKRNLTQLKALLVQARVNVSGCIVNKQRRSRNDTIYFSYNTDRQKDERKYGTTHVNSLPVLQVTPVVFKETNIPSQLDLFEKNDGENHVSNNVNPPTFADVLNGTDQTIKLSQINNRSGAQGENQIETKS